MNEPYAVLQWGEWKVLLHRLEQRPGSRLTIVQQDPLVPPVSALLTMEMAAILRRAVWGGLATVVKAPNTFYAVWHLCFCSRCQGSPQDHSQGTWDEHLRYVDNDLVFTLTAGARK